MQITEEHRNRIDEIIAGMHCPRDFPCYKSEFEKLSRVRLLTNGSVIECLEDRAYLCEHHLSFGEGYLCTCPLRKYIAKHFRK